MIGQLAIHIVPVAPEGVVAAAVIAPDRGQGQGQGQDLQFHHFMKVTKLKLDTVARKSTILVKSNVIAMMAHMILIMTMERQSSA